MLFDHVPPAVLPQPAPPPTRAQDLLEELRFSQQRQAAARAQLAAEEAHFAETKEKLSKQMHVGEYLETSGVSATRVRGKLLLHWGQ